MLHCYTMCMHRWKGSSLKLELIPEQFTVKAHRALFEGKEGEGKGQKIEVHFPEASA